MILKTPKKKIHDVNTVKEIISSYIEEMDEIDRDREYFFVIGCGPKNEVRFVDMVAIGTNNQCPIHPRDILRRAIYYGCCAIIISHNHPSGELEPSSQDRCLTDTIKKCCELLQIKLLDHVIVSGDSCFSFMSAGEI